MNTKFARGFIFSGIVILIFCGIIIKGQIGGFELTLADKRDIIEAVMSEKFKESTEKIVYLSTANLPEELRKDFPPLKNKKIQFVSPEDEPETTACAYRFGEFENAGNLVSVSFGDCSEGLIYDFRKFGLLWKSVGLTIGK